MPQEASSVSTPLRPTMWKSYFSKYPIRQLVKFFPQGVTKGFCIGLDYASTITLKSAKSNVESARFHAEVVDKYLQIEISLRRVAGPFLPDVIPDGHVSRFGVIPKNHQPNK